MGFVGKRNIYTCDACHEHVVTWDRHEGVTPFLITCQHTPGCRGMMKSSLYRVFDQSMRPRLEWYRPSAAEEVKPHLRDHVSRGGLLFRRFEGPNPPAVSMTP